MLGFSLTSPDLVICGGSPEIPMTICGDSPEFSERNKYKCSFELSLENGIKDTDTKDTHKSPSVKFSSICQTFDRELSPESSLELLVEPSEGEKFPENHPSAGSIKAESTDVEAQLLKPMGTSEAAECNSPKVIPSNHLLTSLNDLKENKTLLTFSFLFPQN